MSEGPIMKDGVHPITHTSPKVVKEGSKAAEGHHAPKPAQAAAAGAKPGNGAPKTAPTQKPPMKGAVSAGETLANKIYPEKLGLRGAKA